MIILFTDFGLTGPYTGQVKAVLAQRAPGVPVIDLFADAPACDPKASAYLLAAYGTHFTKDTVFLCVVDPGVGGPRRALVMQADGRWYVGPENGLFEIVARRAAQPVAWFEIQWRPEKLSRTFHGRDMFAPVAATLATNRLGEGDLTSTVGLRQNDWPDDLAEVVYVDVYGNALTGLRGTRVSPQARLEVGGHEIMAAETFSVLPPGGAFWYVNSNGLVEIAVNRQRADEILGISRGAPVRIVAQS
ncbi:SAM-dependent chlorinase/fluorinase [Magnetospira thiophila]